MPTQQKTPALFYNVAMAALLADGAAAIALGQPSGLMLAASLYAATTVLTGLWAYLASQRDDRFGVFLFLATVAAGPFGAGICFLAALVHEHIAPGTDSPAVWIESLFGREPDRESDRLHERIAFGLDDFEAAAGVEPFSDILSSGAVLQKQMAIAKIARYFRPAFAPLLLQAARDSNAAVRVQAATALAKVEREFMARYIRLENNLKDLPDHDPAKLELAALYDEYAHAGLLEESNRHELRLQAIRIYEACLAKRDNPDERIKLARLYLHENRPDMAYDWLRPVAEGKNPPRGVMFWYMEAMFRLGQFGQLRQFSRHHAPAHKDNGQFTDDLQNLFTVWQAGSNRRRPRRIIMKKPKLKPAATADICLILEGTYPYVSGGVAGWTHELIRMHENLTFSLVALVSEGAPARLAYELPPNVINLQTLRLQDLPEGEQLSPADEKIFFTKLEASLRKLQSRAELEDLAGVIEALAPWRARLGRRQLLDSAAAWELLLHLYQTTMPKTSFLDYFWSWRGLFGGLFSILLAGLPQAKVYHAMCTGYAGLLLARAHLETGRPCLVTEHGIYTNERRIEIASADWINDPHGFNLAVPTNNHERDLKDLWIDTFGNYSRFCYEAASTIITLFEGNQEFQRMDGADSKKLRVIPNGIDFSFYDAIERKPHPPTVALIGRVVPIKDIKTYIKAVQILKQSLPDLRAYVMGPADEDPAYARECRALVKHLRLEDTITFTGTVNVREYFETIDAIALTSISEAQPLVILEAGAAGIPTVATDVGACREMIMGGRVEKPALGPGGAVVTLGSPLAVANALLRLLTETGHYERCSHAIKKRVHAYYSKADQRQTYAELYEGLMKFGDKKAPKKSARKKAA